jgi:hypothetical protein
VANIWKTIRGDWPQTFEKRGFRLENAKLLI